MSTDRRFKIKTFSELSYKTQQKVITILFLAIPLILLIVLGYLPVLNMISYSFTNWNGISKTKTFVGLKNYITVLTRPEYFSVFFVSLYYLVGSFIQLALALFIATVLSFKVRLKSLFKGVYFFPNLINGVAIGFIFLYFFRPDGTLDSFLTAIGLGEFTQLWLGNPSLINISLTAVSVWRYIGFNIIMFLGAIQSIQTEIYEAAEMDGANKFQLFRHIILPSIAPIVSLNLLLSVKGALSVFEIPYIMTGGGNGSSTFVIKTVDTAFKFDKVGLASAMAVVLTILLLLVAGLQNLFFKNDR